MADNIIGNGSLKTLTISGSIFLPYTDLYLLTDQGAVASGISLTGETLYIEADISNRLNINDIRFYLTSATSSGIIIGNLNFAYKNYEGEDYIALDKNYNAQYFYVDNITQDFSPRYIRFDINSTTCELLEWEIYANDDIVDFGSDGLQTEYIIDDIPSDDYHTVKIYNNHATKIANAYAAIEYTGAVSDGYIELYDSQALRFYNINDGAILDGNASSSTYKWYHGTYDYTIEENNKIVLSEITYSFVFNPDDTAAWLNISNYGMTLDSSTFGTWGSAKTHGSSNVHGKFYFEVKIDSTTANNIMIGVGLSEASTIGYPGVEIYSLGYYGFTGYKYYGSGPIAFGDVYTVNDIIGVAMDVATGKLWFAKNNVWQDSGQPDAGLNPAFEYNQFISTSIYPMIGLYATSDTVTLRTNSSSFDYTPPTGFESLSDAIETTGTYTTPVFTFSNQYAASYLITNSTTHSGVDNIGDSLTFDSIEVRSSDIEPEGFSEVYWEERFSWAYAYRTMKFNRYVVYNNVETENWTPSVSDWGGAAFYSASTVANMKNEYIIHNYITNSYTTSAFKIVHRDGTVIYLQADLLKQYGFDGGMEINSYGNVWGYSDYHGALALLDFSSGSLSEIYLLDIGTSFINDFSAETNGAGIWYTNALSNTLVHLDGAGNSQQVITSMTTPAAVCSTSDNGCWVVDNNNYSLKRYDYNGNVINTGNLYKEATKMVNDGEDGFFYISGDYVYHVLNTGGNGISVNLDIPTNIINGGDIIVVYSHSNKRIDVVDKENGTILKTITQAQYPGIPGVYSIHYALFSDSDSSLLPTSFDPVWGTSGTLEWKTVKKNEYILPKRLFHQSRITLTTTDHTISPSLDSVAIPPAVKVQDIQPQNSQPLYIRTNFTEGANTQDYITNLRVWWEI